MKKLQVNLQTSLYLIDNFESLVNGIIAAYNKHSNVLAVVSPYHNAPDTIKALKEKYPEATVINTDLIDVEFWYQYEFKKFNEIIDK